jgi:type II restriction enzyme
VQLDLPKAGLDRYKSLAQRARVATEAWGASHLFCANCSSPELEPAAANTPVIDYLCPNCESSFQLKSQSRQISSRIVDAAYAPMIRRIAEGQTPNLIVLQYEASAWAVRNLILIPSFAFSRSAIERRPPLTAGARRAGWVGCNIVLANIPADARISIIREGISSPPKTVRQQYAKLRPLARLNAEARGWTLDVLRIVRSFGEREFSLAEVYAREAELTRLHPHNRHVRDKIRQQLQVLRDLGLLDFLTPGHYRLT